MSKTRKYPKKPKASASVSTLENYLRRCKEVDKHNAAIKSEAKKKESLRKRISGMKR